MAEVENALQLTEESFASEVTDFNGVVLIDFWAAWCGPCRAMAPIIGQLAEKYQGNDKVKIAQFDIEQPSEAQEPIANRYRIMSIPNFIVFAAGKPVGQKIGVTQMNVLEELIEKAVAGLPAAS